MKNKSKTELIEEWMSANDIGGDRPWFDSSNTYYNLRADQIINLASYLENEF